MEESGNPGIKILRSRESLTSESDMTEVSLSPSSTSFLSQLPHLVPSRRNRTASACDRASDAPEVKGRISHFFRQKGHGFIQPLQDGTQIDKIFVHVSDIDCDIVPQIGDEVVYRPINIPPKNEKLQATHVRITKLNGEKHFTWEGLPVTAEVE